VRFVLRHDRTRTLRFAPLQSAAGREVSAMHPELRGLDSMVWLEPTGAVLTRSAAAARVAGYLGGAWRLAGAALRLLPRVLRDRAYDAVAHHRHLAGTPRCLVPPPAERGRFLE
jgi:predicted DCC family thiol-disulfide oxidoreductase YuxK